MRLNICISGLFISPLSFCIGPKMTGFGVLYTTLNCLEERTPTSEVQHTEVLFIMETFPPAHSELKICWLKGRCSRVTLILWLWKLLQNTLNESLLNFQCLLFLKVKGKEWDLPEVLVDEALCIRYKAQKINLDWGPWEALNLAPTVVCGRSLSLTSYYEISRAPAFRWLNIVPWSPISPDSYHSGHLPSHSLPCIPLSCQCYCLVARDGICSTSLWNMMITPSAH